MIPERITPSSELDFDVDTSSQVELHQRVHGLRRRVDDVQETLVRPDFELFTAFLVDVRTPQHRELLDLVLGSGIGPRTCAPVRLAVFTISAVLASSTR
jgi:hypothetical protein